MAETTLTRAPRNRWVIAFAGVVMQIALGAVYAWSVFRDPLMNAFHWTIAQVTWTFTLAILFLGFAGYFGGRLMNRYGPRTVGIIGGILYGMGVFLASFTNHNIWWLYLTYGVIGGIGIGFGYMVPVATLVKWFPDRRGFITGIAVAGFGAGALITAPIATRLISTVGVLRTFAILGIAYLIVVVLASLAMANPPEGWVPAGWKPSAVQVRERAARDYATGEALHSWQWYALWLLLFLNVSAGISIISQAAPMAQEITGVTKFVAAGLVGIISIANGLGRFLWAWFSDVIGRRWVFLAMFLLQAVVFFFLPKVHSFGAFTALCFIVLLCYGGGFGTMPAFVADYFGAKNVGSTYGLMLTAWGFGGVLGPLLIAYIRQNTGHYTQALYIISVIMLCSAVIPFIVRPPDVATAERAGIRRVA